MLLLLLLLVFKLLTISVIFVSLKFQPPPLGTRLAHSRSFLTSESSALHFSHVATEETPGKDVIHRNNCKSHLQALTVEMTHREPFAHYQKPATSTMSQCNRIFTYQSIFRYFPCEILSVRLCSKNRVLCFRASSVKPGYSAQNYARPEV